MPMASSSLRLKQSSLLSFLHPPPPPPPTPPPSTDPNPPTHPSSTIPNTHDDKHYHQPQTPLPPSLPITTTTTTTTTAAANPIPSSPSTADTYERLRQENIRRNETFLLRLGVSALTFPLPHKRKQKQNTTRPPPPPLPLAPLRRSTRHRPDPTTRHDDDPLHPPAITYIDSSVLQYTCTAPTAPATLHPNLPISSSRLRIVGKPLRDSSLSKIYSMDARRISGTTALVAAGGHGGVVAIFGAESGGEDGADEETTRGPLMSWKAGGSWVSGVGFVGGGGKVAVVTSSNDGRVVAWDVTKRESGPFASGGPAAVAEAEGLHRGGVFAMDVKWGWIATASKDASLGVVRVADDGYALAVERRIEGHHCGVIRGVCFGETKDQLADCGADGRICVLDTRLPDPCTLTIETKHATGVNTVEWCPSNMFLLMSASKDPALLLYDIRNPSVPSHELQGHCEPKQRTCSQIYRPAFVDNGSTIATPGPGSRKISIYSVATGELLSQGMVGYDPNLVLFTPDTGCTMLWSAASGIMEEALLSKNCKPLLERLRNRVYVMGGTDGISQSQLQEKGIL